MSFRDRLKVRSKIPSTTRPQDNLSTAIYGFDGLDWIKVKVDTNGSAVVQLQDPTGNTFSVNPDGSLNVQVLTALSTEAKQDDIITLTQAIQDRIGDIISPATGTILELMDQIRQDIQGVSTRPYIVESETALSGVTPTGSMITLPWVAKSLIEKVTVFKESGIADSFRVEILRHPTVTERNTIFRWDVFPREMPRLDLLNAFPYVNLSGLDEIYVRVIPDNGTSNNFYARISGIEAR